MMLSKKKSPKMHFSQNRQFAQVKRSFNLLIIYVHHIKNIKKHAVIISERIEETVLKKVILLQCINYWPSHSKFKSIYVYCIWQYIVYTVNSATFLKRYLQYIIHINKTLIVNSIIEKGQVHLWIIQIYIVWVISLTLSFFKSYFLLFRQLAKKMNR